MLVVPFKVRAAEITTGTISNLSYCEDIDLQDDGTETQKCVFKYKATGKITETNAVKITLSLTNVKIKTVEVGADWFIKEKSDNMLYFETSRDSLEGEFVVATVTFVKVDIANNCRIEYACEYTKIARNCTFFNGKYYNKNGEITDAKTYQKECEPHYCVIWDDGTYFGKNGNIVDSLTYQKECLVNKCVKLSDGTYYDKYGNVTTKETYEKECTDAYKCLKKNGKFYNKQGEETTELQYQKEFLIWNKGKD